MLCHVSFPSLDMMDNAAYGHQKSPFHPKRTKGAAFAVPPFFLSLEGWRWREPQHGQTAGEKPAGEPKIGLMDRPSRSLSASLA
jgi:hypothetical protein